MRLWAHTRLFSAVYVLRTYAVRAARLFYNDFAFTAIGISAGNVQL